jgi:hypothetical protein
MFQTSRNTARGNMVDCDQCVYADHRRDPVADHRLRRLHLAAARRRVAACDLDPPEKLVVAALNLPDRFQVRH